MRIGIFFGGQSREREISFAGGRTVFDNLDKNLFTPIPIFVDSVGNFILLNWKYIYKGTIRDFYPPVQYSPEFKHDFQIYIESLHTLSDEKMNELIENVGTKIQPSEFEKHIDFAFLALHGPFGEDGNIQGLLEWYNIPYSGSGILPSAIGINKVIQKKLMSNANFLLPKSELLSKSQWLHTTDVQSLFFQYKESIGWPLVIKAPNQGSSIGITVLTEPNIESFVDAIDKAFFRHKIQAHHWLKLTENEKANFVRQLTDIREGIGLPLMHDAEIYFHPEQLLEALNAYFQNHQDAFVVESLYGENTIIIEAFITGKEFSCIVVQNTDGSPLALPPTEIVKGNNFFDYKSKYLPGMSRKITPIQLPTEQINHIRHQCERLFASLSFDVYARIDGFITPEGTVFLNDPNTTSGMMPSSFFFHQAAEIGLNPSQFLTYIIRTSMLARLNNGRKSVLIQKLMELLDKRIAENHTNNQKKIRVGVIMGGFSSERHISVESGRNIYEKLSSDSKYEAIPIFLTGNEAEHLMYIMPINIMLKDNADDIKDKVQQMSYQKHEVVKEIIELAQSITQKYVNNYIPQPIPINYEQLAEKVDAVFIALHGRPGEDGSVQQHLEKYKIPYNGSGIESSKISINKFITNQLLRKNDILVANHLLLQKSDFINNPHQALEQVESVLKYPIIAKPADDGCSSAVKKIKNREELKAFSNIMFGLEDKFDSASARLLGLKYNEEFPLKDCVLLEELISKGEAAHFLEITGGMLTTYNAQGNIEYEVFEPSETLASGEVLSLEEKFLAGEGQNITPARYSSNESLQKKVSSQVRATLEKVARIVQVEGYCRIDAFVRIYENETVETIIIEINSLPGMTPATCIFHQTALNGYKPFNFIDKILEFGIQRQGKLLQ
jgi:D-alanine-D-alanine ligase